MEKEQWLLLAIAAGESEGLTPVQLQKSLFLLGKSLSKKVLGKSFYKFVPYNYGPFNVTIYSDAESLGRKGLVEIQHEGRRWPQYRVTAAGVRLARDVHNALSEEVRSHLDAVVKWTQSKSFSGLLRAIYREYPQYRQSSIFQG